MVKLLKLLIITLVLSLSSCASLMNSESSYIHTTTAMQDVVVAMTSLDGVLATHLSGIDAAAMTDEEFQAATEAVMALRFARTHYIDAEAELRAYHVCEAVDSLDNSIYELDRVRRYLGTVGLEPLDAQLTLARAAFTLDRMVCNGPH